MSQVTVFTSNSYQDFVRDTIRSLPKGGRGELLRLASHIGIHTSTLSQILAHKKNLTLEQACSMAEYFGLNELEARYFLLMVSRARAGTALLRKRYQVQIDEIRAVKDDLKTVIPQDRPLSMDEKAVFYSNWYYTAIWAQTSIPGFQSKDALQRHFQLPRAIVNEVVQFLMRTGLCVEENGELRPGHQYSHLEASSPLISRHHANWRIKAMERHPLLTTSELSYSSPMTLSNPDSEKVRALLVKLISNVNQIRDPSPCEQLRCLNIDWIKL